MKIEETEFHIKVIEWLKDNGVPFMNAMAILSYAIQTDRSIAESYIDIRYDLNKLEAKDASSD